MIVFLSGPSGIGKTTMAEKLAQEYKIPFLVGSAKVLWEKYGIESHLDLIEKSDRDPQFALSFQYALLEYRTNQIKENSNFVSDRSPLDNLVYFLNQLSHKVGKDETMKYIKACEKAYPKTRYLQVYLGLNNEMALQGIENDGFRIDNPYYQLMMDSIFKGVIANNWLSIRPGCILPLYTWDFNERFKCITEIATERFGLYEQE